MLHSDVYNGLPKDWLNAYRARDLEFFHAQIRELAGSLVALEPDSTKFDMIASNLQVALALHDSLHSAGETCSFIMDFINL